MTLSRCIQRVTISLLFVAALTSSARAQFDNAWVTFAPAQNRLRAPSGGPATSVMSNSAEKDMAWGDLDNNGWTDLVIVTRAGSTAGYVLMNRSGYLVDRTALDAADSNVPGDAGFSTYTANRDVAVADVNLDGWLDVITSTSQPSSGGPPAIALPRVYMNKGASPSGTWLGLRYEFGRIPAHPVSGNYADATGVAAGDVTGDGYPDLFLETRGGRDSLLVNDGTGTFIHSGTTRMSAVMLGLGNYWGANVKILDVNGDGLRDIVRCKASPRQNILPSISIAYNDPANVGYFPDALWSADVGQVYAWHVDIADLNQDGFLDIAFPRDDLDALRYGTGFDALNRLTFGPLVIHQLVSGVDDGFGGTNLIVDLDQNGFPDLIQTDVDLDSPGCTRRCHVYHNRATTAGALVSLVEEAGQVTGAWRGVVGMLATDLTGTFDVAAFDIDNDGDLDMVFGRCAGTFVWMNQLLTPPLVTALCFGDGTGTACPCGNFGAAGHGCANSQFAGGALLSPGGSASILGDTFALQATDVPNSPGLFYQSTSLYAGGAGVTFGDGLLCGTGAIVRLGIVFGSGHTAVIPSASAPVPLHVAGQTSVGDTRHYQLWYRDGDVSYCTSDAFNLTNALTVTWAL